MRKTCTVVSALLLLSALASPAGAQERRITFVVKGGLVSSDFGAVGLSAGPGGGTGVGALESFGRTSVGGGIGARVPLDGRWALQIEALLLRKLSAKVVEVVPSAAFGSGFVPVGSGVSDLEVPLLLRYEFGAGGTRPYAFAGPGLVLRLGSDLSGPGVENLVAQNLADRALPDQANRTDVTLGLGAGVDFGVDRAGGWNFEMRSSWGLRSLYGEIAEAPVPTRIDGRTRAFMALLGYRF